MKDRRLWTNQEDQAILELVQLYGNKKWTVISQKMNEDYFLDSRTGKQCRQRWYNHLDPQINKNEWTEQQQVIIFEAHKKYGNKWKQIAKKLEGRTDNSIKNHFYSTLRRSLRRINKFLGSKNSTSQMRDIKPSVLSKILDFSLDKKDNDPQIVKLSQSYKDLPSLIFQFSNFKPIKENIANKNEIMSNQQRQRFQKLIQKILEFNEMYQNQKKVKSNKHKKRNKHNHVSNSTIEDHHISHIKQQHCVNVKHQTYHHEQQVQKSRTDRLHPEIKIEQQRFYQSDGEISDNRAMMIHQSHGFLKQIKEPSMKSEDLHQKLMIIGTPVKINKIDNPKSAEYLRLKFEEQEYKDQILEFNYID